MDGYPAIGSRAIQLGPRSSSSSHKHFLGATADCNLFEFAASRHTRTAWASEVHDTLQVLVVAQFFRLVIEFAWIQKSFRPSFSQEQLKPRPDVHTIHYESSFFAQLVCSEVYLLQRRGGRGECRGKQLERILVEMSLHHQQGGQGPVWDVRAFFFTAALAG